MKKITLLAFWLSVCFSAQSQVSLEATRDFAKMYNLTYDALVPNKIYAATLTNHIVVSVDNGMNWDVLYSFPSSNSYIKDLKLVNGNTALSFGTTDAIHVLDLATNELTASIPVPPSNVADASPSYLSSYDIQNASAQVIIVDTGFQIGFSNFGKTFYTEDGGQNWTEIYYTLENNNVFINNVAVSPSSNKTLLLARGLGDSGVNGGLWLSNNGGEDWQTHIPGIALDAIAFKPDDHDTILVGSSISFGLHPENLYKSTDSGDNWEIVPITWTNETLDNITKIVYNPTNPDKIFILDENETARSTDGGLTWTNVVYPVGISMDYYYGINASYNPFNENQIVITTDFYPQISNDGGATLAQIKAPFLSVSSTSVGKYGSAAHLFYSAQGGRVHKALPSGLNMAYDTENADSFNPKRNYMIADPSVAGRVFTYASMGFFGGFLNVSTDYGATTTNILQAFSDDIQELAVDPINSNIIYVSMRSGESSQVSKIDFSTIDDIIVTDIVTPEMNEFGEGVVTGIIISATDPNEIYISKRNKVFKTIDGGTTWEEKSLGLESISASDIIWDMVRNPLNPNQFAVATNFGIFTTDDAAENWSQVLNGSDVRRVKYSSNNDGVIVGAIHTTQFSEASIVYSVDNGAVWETIGNDQLHYVQAYAMDFNFEGNTIESYIGTSDLGIIKYTITDLPLNVKNPISVNAFSIYPNPAQNEITLLAANGSEIKSIAVYSVTGQQMLIAKESKLNISALSAGTYIVKVENSDGKFSVRKLIKK